MGWFDEQIKQRIKNDDLSFSEAFTDMAEVVMNRKFSQSDKYDDTRMAKDAIEEILKYYHIPLQELPLSVKETKDVLDFYLQPSGIMRRNVTLKDEWYKDGVGPLMCITSDGEIVSLIPKGASGYTYYDRNLSKKVKVTSKNADKFSGEAICFYKPFPLEEMNIKSLMKYMMGLLSAWDYISVIVATLAVTLMGLFTAYINNMIFTNVIHTDNVTMLVVMGIFMLGVIISQTLIGITKSVVLFRITTKLKIPVESATMMRVLGLPVSFFKKYSSGDLSARVQSMAVLSNMIVDIFLSSGLSTVLSVAYIMQIFKFSPTLAIPALSVVGVTLLFTLLSMALQMKQTKKIFEAKAKENGLVFSLLSGIQKIKITGAEKRAFSKWSRYYKDVLQYRYNPPKILALNGAISAFISVLGTILLYFIAVSQNVSMAEYMTFNVSYGLVIGSFVSFATIALQIGEMKPTLEMVEPIFKEVPEMAQSKKVVTRLSGSIEISNVSFRYSDNMPNVINNLSLNIRAGQYVAIVGKTGCGKSTLMRILLGFEKPQKGTVYYDKKDIATLDLKSLRRNIGTVMQNGKLFAGDIYSNIVISAPHLSVDDAWKAAEMAGIAEDIRYMPMQMHTIISEGSGGISGGQRQRLMIARAIAPNPRILMFDEATSALDNITQKIVSESLAKLRCTRIVIAHRLSTIKECDRIIVLDGGRIIEDGTYDELISKNGYFAELVERQRVDN